MAFLDSSWSFAAAQVEMKDESNEVLSSRHRVEPESVVSCSILFHYPDDERDGDFVRLAHGKGVRINDIVNAMVIAAHEAYQEYESESPQPDGEEEKIDNTPPASTEDLTNPEGGVRISSNDLATIRLDRTMSSIYSLLSPDSKDKTFVHHALVTCKDHVLNFFKSKASREQTSLFEKADPEAAYAFLHFTHLSPNEHAAVCGAIGLIGASCRSMHGVINADQRDMLVGWMKRGGVRETLCNQIYNKATEKPSVVWNKFTVSWRAATLTLFVLAIALPWKRITVGVLLSTVLLTVERMWNGGFFHRLGVRKDIKRDAVMKLFSRKRREESTFLIPALRAIVEHTVGSVREEHHCLFKYRRGRIATGVTVLLLVLLELGLLIWQLVDPTETLVLALGAGWTVFQMFIFDIL